MTEIVITDVTTGTLPGSGAFDELMKSNQLRLDKQFTQNRLRGADYAKVYLGSMEAIMQQSIVYILGRQEADKKAELIEEQTIKTTAETALVEAQTTKTIAETLLVEAQTVKTGAETNLLVDQLLTETLKRDLLSAQIIKVDAETDLLVDQLLTEALKRDQLTAQTDLLIDQLITEALKRDKLDAEIALLIDQLLTELAKRDQLVAETALITQKTLTEVENTQLVIAKTVTEGKQQLLIDKQILKMTSEIELLVAQIQKMQHEINLMEAQVWTEKGKVSDDVSITVPPVVLSGLMGGQIRKIDNEGLLLAEKVITEQAQTKDVAVVESVIGKQLGLYQAQTDGFSRDAEQKLAKIMADSWNTRRVTDEGTSARNTGLEDDEINRVLNAAKNGIGIRWNIREVLDSNGDPTGTDVTEVQNPANTFCIPEDPGCV